MRLYPGASGIRYGAPEWILWMILGKDIRLRATTWSSSKPLLLETSWWIYTGPLDCRSWSWNVSCKGCLATVRTWTKELHRSKLCYFRDQACTCHCACRIWSHACIWRVERNEALDGQTGGGWWSCIPNREGGAHPAEMYPCRVAFRKWTFWSRKLTKLEFPRGIPALVDLFQNSWNFDKKEMWNVLYVALLRGKWEFS